MELISVLRDLVYWSERVRNGVLLFELMSCLCEASDEHVLYNASQI